MNSESVQFHIENILTHFDNNAHTFLALAATEENFTRKSNCTIVVIRSTVDVTM